jgi:ESCRT-II complex subunit VPS22
MRRGVGLGAFDRRNLVSQQFASHGTNLQAEQLSSLTAQLEVFQSLLQQFAASHAREIRSNPAFRTEFARMCAAIGVDPLASSNSGGGGSSSSSKREGSSFWAQMLGRSVNDFYFELAVRVVEVCRATKGVNGGLMAVSECRERVVAARGPFAPDVEIGECVGRCRSVCYCCLSLGHYALPGCRNEAHLCLLDCQ